MSYITRKARRLPPRDRGDPKRLDSGAGGCLDALLAPYASPLAGRPKLGEYRFSLAERACQRAERWTFACVGTAVLHRQVGCLAAQREALTPDD